MAPPNTPPTLAGPSLKKCDRRPSAPRTELVARTPIVKIDINLFKGDGPPLFARWSGRCLVVPI